MMQITITHLNYHIIAEESSPYSSSYSPPKFISWADACSAPTSTEIEPAPQLSHQTDRKEHHLLRTIGSPLLQNSYLAAF